MISYSRCGLLLYHNICQTYFLYHSYPQHTAFGRHADRRGPARLAPTAPALHTVAELTKNTNGGDPSSKPSDRSCARLEQIMMHINDLNRSLVQIHHVRHVTYAVNGWLGWLMVVRRQRATSGHVSVNHQYQKRYHNTRTTSILFDLYA